jgi:hypothetical protein
MRLWLISLTLILWIFLSRHDDSGDSGSSGDDSTSSKDWKFWSNWGIGFNGTPTASPGSPLKPVTPNNSRGDSITTASESELSSKQTYRSESPQQGLQSSQTNVSDTDQNQFRVDRFDVLANAVESLLKQRLRNNLTLSNAAFNDFNSTSNLPGGQPSNNVNATGYSNQTWDFSNQTNEAIAAQILAVVL